MKPKCWVLGGKGLLAEGLQALQLPDSFDFAFLSKSDFELTPNSRFPAFRKGDAIIDLIPSPIPRLDFAPGSGEYHRLYTTPHKELMSAAAQAGISRYVFVSSGGAIYGPVNHKNPISEAQEPSPISLYGQSKLQLERHLEGLNISLITLRPANVYNANANSLRLTGIIGAYLKVFRTGLGPLEIHGSSQIAKDYVSNKDVAQALISALTSQYNGIVNIGMGFTTSIAEIIQSFEKRFKKELPIKTIEQSRTDISWFCLDIKRAKEQLHFQPEFSVTEWIETQI